MEEVKLIVEQWDIERLIPYARNPRKNDEQVDRMCSAIKEFGFRIPIVAKSDGSVVDGHLRLKAAKKLGLTTVPVALADELTKTQVKAFRLLANQSANWAEWDKDLLKLELEELKEEDFDIDMIGFDEDTLDILRDPEEVVEDIPPEPEEVPISKEGDVWLCGRHRVLCGDCTDAGSVAVLMAGELADMVFTDPPYNVAIGSKNKFLNEMNGGGNSIEEEIIGDKGMSDEEIGEKLWKPAFQNLYDSAKDSCCIYVTMPQGGAHMMMMMMMMCSAFWQVKHELIWVKNAPTFSMGRLDYDYKHEPVLYGWKKTHNFYGKGYEQTSVYEDQHKDFSKMKKEELVKLCETLFSDKVPTSVIRCDKPLKSELHPTMKPIKLIANFILNSSLENSIVIDTFGGSGSTLIACEQTNRRCFTMEIAPKYVDVIVRRWQKLTGKEATLEGDGRTFEEIAWERSRDYE